MKIVTFREKSFISRIYGVFLLVIALLPAFVSERYCAIVCTLVAAYFAYSSFFSKLINSIFAEVMNAWNILADKLEFVLEYIGGNKYC